MFTFPATFFSGITSNGLLNDLVSYYEFENNVLDSHGSNDCTDNGTTDIAGKILRGRDFDGINDYIVSTLQFTETSTSFTLATWAKFDGTADSHIMNIGIAGSATTNMTLSYVSGSGLRGLFYNGSTFPQVDYTWTPTLGQFYHLAYTYDNVSGLGKLYVNGIEQASTSQAGTPVISGIQKLYIGRHRTGGAFFNGALDESGVFGASKSGAEITSLVNGGSGLPYSQFTT